MVALLTLITLELIRSSGPLLDLEFGRGGVVSVARSALVTYLAPGLAVLVLFLARRRTRSAGPSSLLVGVAVLVAMRVVVQGLEGGARFTVGLATVAVAIAVLTLAVAALAARPDGGRTAAGAFSAGAAAGVGLQLALGTWDAYWRHTLLGWSMTVVAVGCLLWLAVLADRDPATAPTREVSRLWVLGPLLALAVMMLANPAFAASQSGLPLAVAGPGHALGLLLASWLVTRSSRQSVAAVGGTPTMQWSRWVMAGVLVLLVGGALSLGGGGLVAFDGVLVMVALLGAQITAIQALGIALTPRSGRDEAERGAAPGRGSYRLAGTACLIGLGTIVPLLVYQIDYTVPLGFPNELVLAATAVLLGAAALRRDHPTAEVRAGGSRPLNWVVYAASCALVLVGTGIAAGTGIANHPATAGTEQQPGAGSGVVVSWNVHYGVSPDGAVNLEAIAQTIEAQNADAVLLQEVSRGWVLGGGVDMATWLSHRLGRQFVFAPAADRRFGNVILTPTAATAVEIHDLPYGDGPQERSAISAQVRVGRATVRVAAIHLQQRRANTPTRTRQLESFLADISAAETPGPAMIVGADLNAEPGWPEITVLTDAGFLSAIDTAGDPTALTSPNPNPRHRIDWVFGRGVAFGTATVLAEDDSSDHLPLVVTVAPQG